ncbi:hypothetical protein JCM5296_000418 [Sporobolomyces johnsonii]
MRFCLSRLLQLHRRPHSLTLIWPLARKMEAIEEQFKSLAITTLGTPGVGGISLAKRPDNGGTLGRKIELVANLYRVRFKQSAVIAHYDVAIVPISTRAKEVTTTRQGGGGAATERSVNRETAIAIWDALVASNPDGLGPDLNKAGFDCRKNAFCLGLLRIPGNSKTFRVSLEPESDTRPGREFDIKLQLAQQVDLSVLEKFTSRHPAANVSDQAATAIMALNVLLRHSSFRKQGWIVGSGGRKFLDSLQSTLLGQGAQVLGGLFQSVRPTMLGIAVNLDTAFSPYIVSGNLLHVCRAITGRDQGGGAPAGRGGRGGFRGGRGGARGGFGGAGGPVASGPFSDREIHELKRKLRNSKVRVTHRVDRRPFVIVGFGQPAGRHVVSIADRKTKRGAAPSPKEVAAAAAKGEKIATKRPDAPQQTMSVAEYFLKTYKKKVDPDLQVVELRGGQFVPMECLELLSGTMVPSTQLSANQSATMINVAAKPPAERRAAINSIRSQADFGAGSRLDSWGIEVEAQPMRLTGRVLAPPKVHYHPSSAKATPFVNFGSWNLKDSKFLQPNKPLERWGVVVFGNQRDTPPAALQFFFDTLMNQARLRGMSIKVPQPKAVEYWDGREDTKEPIRRAANAIIVNNPTNPSRAPPQILFFILRDPKMYDDLKRKAAFEFPVAIPSQVLLAKKIMEQRGIDQYCGNVCLKLNIKLGGVNSEVKPQDLPNFGKTTMMFGADVTHPTGFGAPRAGEDVPPSIAAVVATTDASGNLYASQVREQLGRKEFITEMKEMTVIHVKEWIKQMKGQRPTQVIMWRDGVSEGQLAPVVQSEIMQIKAAFREIDATWNPKLTYVVCAKRHNVRLFAANPTGQDVDRTGNLPPGVVVDTAITHPYLFEFYLQAHAGLKGTAKPTRYICILDEIGFGSDQLEKLANSLCFNFGRATRSVSLVPIAYYADIVAFKARSFVGQDDDASTTASGVARAVARDRDFIQKKLDRELSGQKYAKMWWM